MANRFKHVPAPTKERVMRARLKAEMTQAEAAQTVYLGHAARWYEYENGGRNIDLARWELFLLKTGQMDLILADSGES